MILQGRRLARCDKLRLESGPLPGGAVMFADIEGAHVNDLIRLVEHLGAGVFPLQIGLLFPGQPLGVAVKPEVYGGLVLFYLHMAALVEQRDDRLVFHRLMD